MKGLILAMTLMLVISAIVYLESGKTSPVGSAPVVEVHPRVEVKKLAPAVDKANRYELAKEITTPDGFINTDGKPVSIGDYIGKKVVLLDFWTYSCINCQRTTPYLNAWYEKYKDKGLVIVGVHTPEFEFEKVYDNVKLATERLGIKYPVVLDNDYSTWSAYRNQYWPRKYLVDIDGYIVYDHIGEGGYETTEKKIQDALKERAVTLGEKTDIDMPLTKEAPSVSGVGSPETYFGAKRNDTFGNGTPGKIGSQNGLVIPKGLEANTFYLGGDWNIGEEYAENKSANAKLVYRYSAKKVFLVAGSATPVRVKIMKDGILTNEITVDQNRLYDIASDETAREHRLEIIIENPGLRIYTFTFG